MKLKNIVVSCLLTAALVSPYAMGKELKSFKLDLVSIPAVISNSFKGLNKKVILYHQVKKSSEKCPLVIYLHGAGGSKNTIESMQWKGTYMKFLNPENNKHNIKMLVPQSSGEWNSGSLNKMLDYILKTNPDIDTNRIYCVGFSRGGKGTWRWGMASPERLAAIAPVAFIPDLSKAKDMLKLPIWAFVGSKDKAARAKGVPAMGKKLKDLGSKVVKTTVFEGEGHGVTGKAIDTDGFISWLFSQSLKNR